MDQEAVLKVMVQKETDLEVVQKEMAPEAAQKETDLEVVQKEMDLEAIPKEMEEIAPEILRNQQTVTGSSMALAGGSSIRMVPILITLGRKLMVSGIGLTAAAIWQ